MGIRMNVYIIYVYMYMYIWKEPLHETKNKYYIRKIQPENDTRMD